MERIQVEEQPVKKQTNLRGAIAGGVTGAAVGGILGTVVGDFALEGTIIGGLLALTAGGLLFSRRKQKKLKFPTGKEVDIYLKTNPILKKYVEAKIGLKVEGNLHFLSNDEFVKQCIKYITKHINYKTRVHYTEEKATKIALKTNAYLSRGKIYINQDRSHAGTIIHEAVHLFQDQRYGYELGISINEGTTEYFTRLLCNYHQLTRHPKYPLQYECIEKLVRVCSQDKLAEAYFLGNISALERAVDATKGQRTFSKWKDFMEKDDFQEANKLL